LHGKPLRRSGCLRKTAREAQSLGLDILKGTSCISAPRTGLLALATIGDLHVLAASAWTCVSTSGATSSSSSQLCNQK
jgi:hypothetical protein